MITKNLESLNIDNIRLNKELTLINKELFPCHKRLNKSFSESTNFEENSIFAYSNTEACEQTLKQLKKRKHTNSTLV